MKPHPRIRKTLTWGGAAMALLLIAAWAVTYRTGLMWVKPGVVGVYLGMGMVSVYSGGSAGPAQFHVGAHLLGHRDRPPLMFSWSSSRTRWSLGVPLWSLVLAAAATSATAWRLDMLARRRVRRGACPKCGYSTIGLSPGTACPECGAAPPASACPCICVAEPPPSASHVRPANSVVAPPTSEPPDVQGSSMPQPPYSSRKARVLFLCTGNSCRSQMAEGWARFLHSGCVEAFSAGTHPKGVDPLAIRAMAEAGVDISGHVSKPVAPPWFDDGPERLDLVITVCDSAANACPVPPPGVRTIHAPFDDPPALAAGCPSDEERLAHYVRVRDEIRRFIERLPEFLDRPGTPPKAW